MRAPRPEEPIELRLQQRQVAILAAAALVLLGVVFALGVLVGRQIASSALGAPKQPPAGDLAALDSARDPVVPRLAAPRPPAPEPVKPAPRPEAAPGASEPARAEAPKAEPATGKPAEKAPEKAPAVAAAPAAPAADDQPPTPDELEDDDAEAGPASARPSRSPSAKAATGKPPAAPKPAAARAPEGGKFTVQLGASPDKAVAQRIEARARAAGLKPYTVEADLGAKGTWYRVRAGAFATKEEAVKFQKDVERELRVSAMVMPAR